MKVVVVDDDVDLLDLMTYALRRDGYTVFAATDGQQGLDSRLGARADGQRYKCRRTRTAKRRRSDCMTPGCSREDMGAVGGAKPSPRPIFRHRAGSRCTGVPRPARWA
jgi:hypothetical protein